MKIFLSSVLKEFAQECKALGEYLMGDPLMRRFFEAFVFERDIPASDRKGDAVYLNEVTQCDLYIGLFGNEYGTENKNGLSPTEIEFDYLDNSGKLNRAPWDTRPVHKVTLEDLDSENISYFVRRARNFPHPPEANISEVLRLLLNMKFPAMS